MFKINDLQFYNEITEETNLGEYFPHRQVILK